MKNLKYYLELIRAKNCLTASFGTIVGGLIASGFKLDLMYNILIASFIVYLICGFGNALNDIYDIEIDRINKPFRPLPSNKISLKNAKIFSWLLVTIGLLLSMFNNVCFVIAIINALALYLYAKKYKRNKIIGNLMVAYLTGSVFIFGGASVNNIGITLILFLCAMFATWSREIIKDFEDMEGDLKEGVMSLPIKYGKKSLYIAGIFLMVAVVLSPLPYVMEMFGEIYLVGILLCDILFIYSIVKLLRAPSKNSAKKSSKNIKYVMNFVCFCFIIGSILK
ncbi:UbiA family prenyltransferase [Methanothermococcus sp.]|uniref:UbiA family prenyltransferase n=1 Tax=Methanothermococcus sp. TaxID=2614238 RepID=UPI0025EAD749|nr:UbiA family prenyltransferase [Methanothermococcus sp.]